MITTPADLITAIKVLIADYEEHQRLPVQPHLPADEAPAAHPRQSPAAGAAAPISQPYAKELARQVDELESENADLRARISVEDMAREAAQYGRLRLVEFYRERSRDEQQRILAIKSELEQLYPVPK